MESKDQPPPTRLVEHPDDHTAQPDRGDFDLGEKRGWKTLPLPTAHDAPPSLGLEPAEPAADADVSGQGEQ